MATDSARRLRRRGHVAAHHRRPDRAAQGVTQEDLLTTFQENPDAVLGLIKVAGSIGSGPIAPGESAEATLELPEGNYLAVDPEADGPPPMGFFEVVAAHGEEVPAPEADWTIEAGDFYFQIEDATAGPSLVEIVNAGEQSHEVILAKAPAKSRKDEVGFFLAPPPGGRMWVELDLQPGEYKAVCFMPDPQTHKAHRKLGMETNFTVE